LGQQHSIVCKSQWRNVICNLMCFSWVGAGGRWRWLYVQHSRRTLFIF
jgi:hypothetical protein